MRDKILAKLAKLKALSECQTGNVNEAATAAAAVARLMLEHQIEMEEIRPLGQERKPIEVEKDDKTVVASLPTWQSILVYRLALTHNCQVYTSHLTYRSKNKRINLIGEREDIENVKTLFTYCVNTITKLCGRWNPVASTKLRNDFKFGAATAVCKRLREMKEQVTKEHTTALALFDAKSLAVQSFLRQEGVSAKGKKTSVRTPAATAFQAGKAAGNSMSLNPNYLRGGSGKPSLLRS